MNIEPSSDNKQIIYRLSLNSPILGLISPYLFIERLRDEIARKLPDIKTEIIYNTKDKGQALVQLNCFSSNRLPDYQVNNLKEEMNFIALTLRDELAHRIDNARRSIA
ncbi:MAG: hypothetical protein FD167_5388 [bacterium]|nr:MAG: hypothetical protein FD167_5388 [bacterium]